MRQMEEAKLEELSKFPGERGQEIQGIFLHFHAGRMLTTMARFL